MEGKSKSKSRLLLRFLTRFVPIGTLTLRTHAGLVRSIAWYPLVGTPLAGVLPDRNFLFSHTSLKTIPKIIYCQVIFLLTSLYTYSNIVPVEQGNSF